MIATSNAQTARDDLVRAPIASYDHLSAADRYFHETRDRELLAMLRRHGIERLSGLRILELGCGDGALLRSLVHYGTDALDAIELDSGRSARAHRAAPSANVSTASVAALPYASDTFDIAFAFTVFSSVLDAETRRRGADEALRVLRPGGLLIVYDFWLNPTNRRVRPLREAELRSLFGGCVADVRRITLAPPVARALRGGSLCSALDRLPFLHTHLLTAVVKEAQL